MNKCNYLFKLFFVSDDSLLLFFRQVLQATIPATQQKAFSYLQQTKSNLSQFSPTVPLIRQWKLLLPFQTTTPTAAASPVRQTTTEMVHWSRPWTTETLRWHTTGRPRGAGWRQSRWLRVRWNPPEHRRTKSLLSLAKLTNRH